LILNTYKKKNNTAYKNGGVDNLSILCYNIGMINEIESFYFILSFAMKENTRRIKP